MKEILIGVIKVYQMIPGPWHNMCRHIPSCSNYGIEAIKKYGENKLTEKKKESILSYSQTVEYIIMLKCEKQYMINL